MNPGQATVVFLNDGKRQGSTSSHLAPNNSHLLKLVAYNQPSYQPCKCAAVFEWLTNYGPNFIRKTTHQHMLADVTERTASTQPITQLRSVIPSFKCSRLTLQRPISSSSYTSSCLPKCICVRGFHTKIWRSSINRNLITIQRTRETVLAAPRAQCVSSSLLRLGLAPYTAVPRAHRGACRVGAMHRL